MPLLEVENIVKTFRRGGGPEVRAVDGVSFSIESGETLSLIGESGSGKSTIGRIVLGLEPPDEGRILFDGQDLTAMSPRELRALRSSITAVFQEPYESLNPRMTVEAIVGEPLRLFRRELSAAQRRDRVIATLEEVGLGERVLRRHPGDLSGGQQQRVGIARALVVDPRMIVLDEPTSSLDLTVRATVLNLLRELQERHALTYLFISHDIATVRYFSRSTGVLYLGKVMEYGPTHELIDEPRHPYSVGLLSCTLSADPDVSVPAQRLEGDTPSPTTRRAGCPLVGRCPVELASCSAAPVPLMPISPTRSAACLRLAPTEVVA
ncbi:MAG: ABC transporter ATP-binding protein [Nocardioidaceae bacterium]|nr:ABC transporter ATP-binding protein [Nocardioidaceae bacterium]